MTPEDQMLFLVKFPEAARFVMAAKRRYDFLAECEEFLNGGMTLEKSEHLKEERRHPACQEPWFVKYLNDRFGEHTEGAEEGCFCGLCECHRIARRLADQRTNSRLANHFRS